MRVKLPAPSVDTTVTRSARRAQIIAATIAVVAEKGLAAASFKVIAERAGVPSTRMISYHFTDRHELIEAAVSDVFRRAADYLEPWVQVEDPPEEQLRTLIRANAHYAATHRTDVAAVGEIWATHRTADGALRYGPDDMAIEVDLYAGLLAAGQARGSYRDFDPRFVAVVLRQAMNAVNQLLLADPDADPDPLADELITTVDAAVRR